MIAKRISRRVATSSAARLIRYMVAAEGGIDPQSWARTADYILATNGTTRQGEKVAGYRVTNCETDDPGDATTLIQATQARNTKSKTDKTYHLVFSFREGEHPTIAVLHEIEDELCEVLGYADHQRISAVHIDTDNLHVHVAINKVHPKGLQNIEPFYDKQRLMEACERLEKKFDLEHDDHGLTGERAYDRRNRIRLGPEREHDSRFRTFLRESYARALAERPEAKSYNDLRNLSGSDVAYGGKRYSMLLQNHAPDSVGQSGTEHPDGLRRPGNGAHGVRPSVILKGGPAADMEAQAGLESLTGYVSRDVAPALRRATTWQELHDALADHGLEIKARGAGLVIGDSGLNLWCKASDCGRDLSMKALTDRLGPMRSNEKGPPKAPGEQPAKGYQPRPRQNHPSSSALFAEYQRQRQAAIVNRRRGLTGIREARAAETDRIRRWASTQRVIQKVGPRGAGKAAIAATTRAQVAAARNRAKAQAATATADLFKATTMPTWNEWLMHRAERGDVDALSVLRGREEREAKVRGDLLTAEKADQAKTRIMESLRPQARHDGTMAYRTADGGLVLDKTTQVKAETATAGAAFVALTLAAERFEGQPLDVQGSEQFRQDVARFAGMHRVNVVFSDPALEALRRATSAEREPRPAKGADAVGRFSRLVDHGPAPFENKEGARTSYFVTIEAEGGARRTLWGVDLERALAESGAVQGDMVNVEHRGSIPVRLPNGQTAQRNTWQVNLEPNEAPPGQRKGEKSQEASQAIHLWIEKRNLQRDKISTIPYNRLWTPQDAGKATYEGRRRMEDGSEILLLKRGDEMLVKPAGPRVVAKASLWKVGQAVTLDARGRFVERARGIEL